MSNNATNYLQVITVVDTNVPGVCVANKATSLLTNDPGERSAVVNFGQTTAMELGFDQRFEDPNWVSGAAQKTTC